MKDYQAEATSKADNTATDILFNDSDFEDVDDWFNADNVEFELLSSMEFSNCKFNGVIRISREVFSDLQSAVKFHDCKFSDIEIY